MPSYDTYRISSVVAALAASMTFAISGHAAVRKCADIISSDIATAPSELEAKKKAMDQWHAKVAKLGPGFGAWRISDGRQLKCFPKDGGFQCVAFAAPCMVDQTPNTPITQPGDKGKGI